jgi:hypothetical protein
MTKEKENRLLKVTHNAGFFSCCTIRLMEIINFHNKNNKLPIVDSSEQWYYYKDFEEIDITRKFFENKDLPHYVKPEILTSSDDENQFSDFSLINYSYVTNLLDTYFSPTKDIINFKNFLIEKYGIDINKTISICYRGNDKSRETILPSYEEMLSKIVELKNKYPDHKLLIQTDELEFLDFILNKYPNSIVIDETKKINKSNTAIQHIIPKGERVENAQKFLSVMLLISETSKIILNSGNVGMWICLYRGNNNGVFQYLNPINKLINNKWIN